MTDRAEFIAGVTAALGRQQVVAPAPDSATAVFEGAEAARQIANRAMAVADERSAELLGQMAEAASSAGWQVHHAANPEDAPDLIAEICHERGASNVFRSAHTVLTDIPLDAAVRATGASIAIAELGGSGAGKAAVDTGENSAPCASSGPSGLSERERARAAVFSADVGITGVDYAIAETGTVVLHPRKGVSRLVSLAPPTHIAVLRPGEVLESLDELFAIERDNFLSSRLSGSMNLISGPSKTGDIEGTIVTGIHGPLEVHLVILGRP